MSLTLVTIILIQLHKRPHPHLQYHILQSMQLHFSLEVRGGKWRRERDEHVSVFYPSFTCVVCASSVSAHMSVCVTNMAVSFLFVICDRLCEKGAYGAENKNLVFNLF